ncbi:hypothetical protein V1264_011874 [Littorina saxatilis]
MEEESLSNVDVFLREELFEHGDKESADAAHNLTALRNLVAEAKQTHREVGSNTKEYLSHPVNVFHLARRLRTGWKNAIGHIRNSKPCKEWHMPQLISRLANIEDNLPSEGELTSVTYNLLTIQHTQGIRTQDLLRGKVGNRSALEPISPQEQFQVAKVAVDEDDYFYAAQWLKHLSRSAKLKDMRKEEDGFNATNVLGMLASAYFRINMLPEALKVTNQLLKKDPENMVARTNKVFFEERIARGKESTKTGSPKRFGNEDTYRRNFERLCRGTEIKPKRLKCVLLPTWPRSKLSFHKLEILNRRPPIVAFHGVVSRRDATRLVDVAEEEYEKIAMDSEEGFRTPEFTLVMSKLGKTRAAQYKQQQLLSKIRTKLSTLPYTVRPPYTSGESEARNFGHQGFYIKPNPHFQIQNLGAHTGTAMVFLNDVEMGGEIVFPTANTRIAPQMGTVVFYFPSFKKFHTICPVAYGTEWVLIHSFYERRAPYFCRLHEDPDLQQK